MKLLMEGIKKLTGTISVEEAQQLLERGGSLIDVRSPQEFAANHAKIAINMPLDTLTQNISQLPKAPLILHCQSGMRSRMAVQQLKRAGIEPVYNLGGLRKALQLSQYIGENA